MLLITTIKVSLVVIVIFCIEIIAGLYRSEFITLRQYELDKWLKEEKVATTMPSNKQPNEMPKLSYVLNNHPYKLRYNPSNPRPRLFWHKLPQQQEELTTTTQMPAAETTEMPQEPIEPEITENPSELPTTPPPPDMTITSSTMESMTSTTLKTPLNSATSTTITTIMKPASHFPLNIVDKLKQLLLFGSPAQVNLLHKHNGVDTKGKTKSKGFLSLFEVIKFANTKCSVSMGDIRSLDGICYHEFECKSLGGISTERCGEGLGVCCIFLTGCGDTIGQSVSYFESPNYPLPVREMIICVLIINLRNNVQQLRLDFLMFELNRPTDGDCNDDQFIVSGQNVNFVVPILCGINSGQHIYIDVGNSVDRKIYLTFLAKVPTGARSFNIKVMQLEDNLAPDGCLQYYTELEGVVKSFNYDIEGTIVDNKEATYFNNLNYVICLERAKDYCMVNYVMEQIGGNGADQLDFQIINKDEAGNNLVPDGQAGAGIFNCPDDFIAINQVRLCGERFNDGTEFEDFTMNAPVKDVAAGPIILPFRSDAEYVGRGFRLAFKQELCL